MMALTGMILKITENADGLKSVTYGSSVGIPAFLQILMSVLGIALLIFMVRKRWALKFLRKRRQPAVVWQS